jgi:DNA invertase Pin-like site-specific DNA recombinase
LSKFERNLIRERTHAGLSAARARGRMGGRKPKLKPAQVKTLLKMYDSRKHTIKEICKVLKISKPTLYEYLKRAKKRAEACKSLSPFREIGYKNGKLQGASIRLCTLIF